MYTQHSVPQYNNACILMTSSGNVIMHYVCVCLTTNLIEQLTTTYEKCKQTITKLNQYSIIWLSINTWLQLELKNTSQSIIIMWHTVISVGWRKTIYFYFIFYCNWGKMWCMVSVGVWLKIIYYFSPTMLVLNPHFKSL